MNLYSVFVMLVDPFPIVTYVHNPNHHLTMVTVQLSSVYIDLCYLSYTNKLTVAKE